MRTILALIKKEFYQVRRDPVMLRLIFLMPLIQLLLLGYVVNTDVREVGVAVYDYDNSRLSRDYLRSLTAGDYFIVKSSENPLLEAETGFRRIQHEAALVIGTDFSKRLQEEARVPVGFLLDGSNASSASIAMGYAGLLTQKFNQRNYDLSLPVEIHHKILYNPEQESVYYMVPGIVAVLLTMITVMLTSMAIVREREIGTLEQLLVTPISKSALLLGKIIPFAILGFIEMSIALAFGVLWFGIPFVGSWPLLYGLSFIFLFTTLGAGIFISTVSRTQQQAMFYAWFFMIFVILTSGFFIPIQNMPQSIQYMTYLNPVRYFMVVVRGIMMKGSGVAALYPQIVAMVGFSAVIFTVSALRFGKRVK
jgi:ABC-2 type transport system permease protein